MQSTTTTNAERSYVVHGEFAAGGMATVHFGRVTGSRGFARTVAVKKLHPNFAKDPDFFAMFLDEARLAARIHHPNVVDIFDVVAQDDEVFLVMDYVHGESLSSLLRRARESGDRVDAAIVASVIGGVLHGLHAAHEARSETGSPLHIVHRDVSPQNILVGVDGGTRVLDFGVARAKGQQHATRQGQIKGKLAYMSPEQLEGHEVDRRSDIYSAGVVCWEMLAGRFLFEGDNEGRIVTQVLQSQVPAPSTVNPEVSSELDRVVLTALSRDPMRRFPTARDMAIALESAAASAGPVAVGEWVQDLAGDVLTRRAAVVAGIESGASPAAIPSGDAVPGTRVLRVLGDTLRSDVMPANDASPMPATASRPTSRRRALAGSLVVVLMATLGILQLRRHDPSATNGAPVATQPTPTPTATTTSTTTPTPTPTPTPAAIDPSPGVRSKPGAASADRLRPRHPSPHVERPAPSAPTRACDPPYTMVSGVKLPKPECPLD